jgi:hypothetical protein
MRALKVLGVLGLSMGLWAFWVWAAVPAGAPVIFTAPDTVTMPSGTTFAARALSASETVVLSGIISPTQITADQHDYNPSGFSAASIVRVSTDASHNLTGLLAGSGRVVLLSNIGAQDLVLVAESSASAEANRFSIGSNITLTANKTLLLHYDTTSTRWRVAGSPGGASGDILDDDGELLNPEIVTKSFILRGAGAPSAGSCPHDRAFYSDTTSLGDTYICYANGGNWSLIGANDDTVASLIPKTGSTLVATGPTNFTLTGGACVDTNGSGSTMTTTLACGSDARGDLLRRGASAYERVALGATRSTLTSNGTDAVWGTAKVLRLEFGCNDDGTTTTGSYYMRNLNRSAVCSADDSASGGGFAVSTRTGVIQRLYCVNQTAPGASQTVVYTVRIEEVNTALTCTMSGASATTCSDTSNTAAITAGELVSINYDPSADIASLNMCALEIAYE